MSKPTVFFSHSSKDKTYISTLRQKILKATSKTIDIFQSSDGESIPFGNNWVHKIEENLNKAKIMLVFVSPQSVNSNWIHFESGFAYAKGVKVIPIGIKGIDVGKLSPPINLLQGFNISSEAGINNIVSIINKEFDCDFNEDFLPSDYAELSQHDEAIGFPSLFEVDYVRVQFVEKLRINDERSISLKENPLEIIQQCLQKLGIQFVGDSKEKIQTHGMVVTYHAQSHGVMASSRYVELKIDSSRLITSKEVIENLCASLYCENLNKFWCNVFFNRNTILETTDFKVSSRLHHVGLHMSSRHANLYEYKEISFALEQKNSPFPNEAYENSLRVVFDTKNFNPTLILELIPLLYEAKVIYQKGSSHRN